MRIQEKIQKDMIQSIKDKNPEVTSILRVTIGEFARVKDLPLDKSVSDEQSIKVINKLIEYAKENKNDFEIAVLTKYVPQMLSENEIKNEITVIVTNMLVEGEPCSIGNIMKKIKMLPNSSLIDGKIASKIANEIISNSDKINS
jgi:uncharacterized protein YqeY